MSAYSAQVIADGASVYYRHGEAGGTTTLVDAIAGVNGTYAAGITSVAGAINIDSDTAVSFPGTTNGGNKTSHTALDLGDNFSVEGWFKRGSIGTVQTLYSKGTNAYDLTFNASDQLEFRKAPGGVVAHTPALSDMTAWHHLVATKNGTTRCIYIDGVDVAILDTNVTMTDSTAAFRIGFFSAGNARFTGSIDETALYKSALTAAQVLNHYELGQGMFRIPAAPITVTIPAAANDLSIAPPSASVSGAAPTTPTSESEPVPSASISGAAVAPSLAQSEGIPPATASAAASNPSGVVSISVPAGEITADAAIPATSISVAPPAASISGVATGGGSDAEAVPPAEITADAAPPQTELGATYAIPAAPIDGAAPAPATALEIAPPSGPILGDTAPPEGFSGVLQNVPAAGGDVFAPAPAIQLDQDVAIPPAGITANAVPPVGSLLGVGDTGGGGGMGGSRAKRFLPQPKGETVRVKVPSARINAHAPEPNWFLNEPDDDLIIMLLYGPQA